MATGRSPRTVAAVLACALLLVASLPAAHTFPYDPEEHSYLREVASWKDPGGAGADLRFKLSPDATRLLLVGYGAPGEVRVTDLDLGNATVLEPPSPGFVAKGADWSQTGERIAVWGEAQEGPRLAVYDQPSYIRNTTAGWLDLVTFPEVTEVSFFADDIIVSVAGRDGNGTSHLMFIEAHYDAVRWDHIWEGNHTILEVADSSRELVIADSGGTITYILGHNWNEFERFPGALHGGAASWHVPVEHQWGFGDAEGRVVMSHDFPFYPQFNVTVGDGPVTGFAWTFGRMWDFVTALRLPGGGTRLDGWQTFPEDTLEEVPEHLCSLDIEGNVTMMGPDPRGWSRVLVAMDDGTLASYKLDIRPKPPYYELGDPDDPDGRGLEPFAAWHMEGTPDQMEMRFHFNYAGSLIALQGFGGHNDLRVINRTFDEVAEIPMPIDDFLLVGVEWSSTGRWLVYWGYPGPDWSELVLRAYDVPSFNDSTSFDAQLVLNVTNTLWDMLFLPGDRVLALSCYNDTGQQVVMLLDLGTGEVLSEVLGPEGTSLTDLMWDGENMVALSMSGRFWTLSPPYGSYNRTGVGPSAPPRDVSVNASSGWCHLDQDCNVTVMNGTPREEVLGFEMVPDLPNCIAWTGVPGDFVVGAIRWFSGSSLQLWRLGAGEEGDWRSVGGARLMTELNSSRTVKQIEADPAFPGLMAVSFDDGTLALYHLNLTPYPAPPEELGGLDIDPYIPPPDDGDGNETDGNDSRDWGSYWDWVFPVVLAVLLVVLVAAAVVLRVLIGREGD